MAELQRTEITARIKQARIEAGLTQSEMADLLTVAGRTYQNYESDRVPWSLLGRISDATGRSTTWLLHGEDPPGDLRQEITDLRTDVTDLTAQMILLTDAVQVLQARLDEGHQEGSTGGDQR